MNRGQGQDLGKTAISSDRRTSTPRAAPFAPLIGPPPVNLSASWPQVEHLAGAMAEVQCPVPLKCSLPLIVQREGNPGNVNW